MVNLKLKNNFYFNEGEGVQQNLKNIIFNLIKIYRYIKLK